MKQIYASLLLCMLSMIAVGQDDLSALFKDSTDGIRHKPVYATFKSTRIINGHSNETLKQHDLDFRVWHNFEDIAGGNGGIKNFFGLDNSTDVKISFEYGITNRLMVGAGRAKGDGVVREIWNLDAKYRLVQQTRDNRVPVAITLFASSFVSTMKAATDAGSPASFHQFYDRLSFLAQAIIARKFSEGLSLALTPTYLRRNYVAFMDDNDMFALGMGGRWKLTKRVGLVVDYFLPFRSKSSIDFYKTQGITYYNPLAIGVEIETGGHVFHMNFTNSTGLQENEFIPNTTRSWTRGEFRWAFTISRIFTLGRGGGYHR